MNDNNNIDLTKFSRKKVRLTRHETIESRGVLIFPDDIIASDPYITEEELLDYQEAIEKECGYGDLVFLTDMKEIYSDEQCDIETEDL